MSADSAVPRGWPKNPTRQAYHGLLGEIVRAIEPHTEADPVALLVQGLALFGNVIGREPHFMVESTRHALNLFVVLVGDTSKGRKGTALDRVKGLVASADTGWSSDRIQSGLSSGEGLIWAVRDWTPSDVGVADKRLLVVESEFASLLRILRRDGNVVSATIRQAWDSGDLRILTKNSPAVATGAHISIIGHVSAGELRVELDNSSASNGFGNRFQWVCVRRSKLLPEGGIVDPLILDPLANRIRSAVQWARTVGEIRRDEEARALWHDVYGALSAGRDGLVGSLTARSEAQVMRLACLYALLDHSAIVRTEHLEAGLALWRYEEASIECLFGDATGNPIADRIREELRVKGLMGLSRTEIRDLFSGHAPKKQIDEALELLKGNGTATNQELKTGGRSEERWVIAASETGKGHSALSSLS